MLYSHYIAATLFAIVKFIGVRMAKHLEELRIYPV